MSNQRRSIILAASAASRAGINPAGTHELEKPGEPVAYGFPPPVLPHFPIRIAPKPGEPPGGQQRAPLAITIRYVTVE